MDEQKDEKRDATPPLPDLPPPKAVPYVESPPSPSKGMNRLRQIPPELRALAETSSPPGIIWRAAGELIWEAYSLGAFEREDEPTFDKLRANVRSQFVNYSGPGSYADWRGGVFAEAVIFLAPQYRPVLNETGCREALPVIADVIEREIAHIEPDDPTPPQPGGGYLAADLRNMTGLAGNTVNKYAKKAGVATPGRGKKDYRCPADDMRKILKTIIENTTDRRVKKKCEESLANLSKTTS